jgi:RNA polymerase sigma factor (sigma-70 family)
MTNTGPPPRAPADVAESTCRTDRQPAARDLAGVMAGQRAFVWTYLRMLGCRGDEADDLTQDTLLVLCRRSDLPEPLRPFLLRTARNLFLGARRRRTRDPVPAGQVEAIDREWLRQAGREDDEWLDALAACRNTLPDRQRRALQLYYGQGLALEAAAAELDLRPAGLKTLLQRVRAHLRDCVRRRLP